MKTINKFLAGAAMLAAFTSCSEHDFFSDKDVHLEICTEDATHGSRAVSAIDGYELKCVMQLLDANGATVGEQAIVSAADGRASFTVKAAQIDAGAEKALFWAEYVPTAGAKKVYNSEDLTKIAYNTVAFDNAVTVAASDAFAGAITTLSNGAAVTLTRPMIKFNFTPTNREAGEGANTLAVSYAAPSGYNVLTATTAGATELSYTNAAFDANTKNAWFTSFIIAPANLSKLNSEMKMSISGTTTKTVTIPADKIPLDANYIVNATGTISGDGGSMDIEVSLDGNFKNPTPEPTPEPTPDPTPTDTVKPNPTPDPTPAAFEVGCYIDAAGNPVANVESAVAVLFYKGAMEGDDSSLYPAQYAGKTIKGYAVALENTIKGRQQLNKDKITAGFTPAETLKNGTQNTDTFLKDPVMSVSDCMMKFVEFKAAKPLTTGNITDWYIPAQPQMQAWISMLMNTTALNGVLLEKSGSEAFCALFPLNTIFDRDPMANCAYLTCSVNSGNNVMGCSLTAPAGSTAESAKFSQIDIKTKTQSVLLRPMFTIFE